MNKKKNASSSKKKSTPKTNLNALAVEALTRLDKALSELDSASNNDPNAEPIKNYDATVGLPMGHWRDISVFDSEVDGAYKMMDDGAQLVKATSTKYTLLGKIDRDDGSRLTEDLRKGCELIATSTLLLHQPLLLCSRPTRHFAKRHARAVVATVLSLVQSFAKDPSIMAKENGMGAQKTGAVWSACDDLLERMPRGNRGCARREVFMWVGDCNETTREFRELVDLGASVSGPVRVSGVAEGGGEDAGWDDFCENVGTGDRYTATELPIAEAALALVKCSRGVSVNVVLKACECAGVQSAVIEEKITKYRRRRRQESEGQTNTKPVEEVEESETVLEERLRMIRQWISDLHETARSVGEGVTDLGMAMYPPLDLRAVDSSSATVVWYETPLGQEVARQRDCLLAVVAFVEDGKGAVVLDEEISRTMEKLRVAIGVRVGSVKSGLCAALAGG